MDFFTNIPPQIATLILAMLPVTELRFSIPFALEVLNLSPWEAFFWSIIGDIIPAIGIVYLLGPLSRWLRRHSKWADRMLDKAFAKTRRKFDGSYSKLGKVALIFFVAIPLPGTGAWSGSIAAWLFDIEKKESIEF